MAVIRNPTRGGGKANFAALQAAASPLQMEVSAIDLRDVDAIERGIANFAGAPNGGLIVPPAALATTRRGVIIELAARYRLPAVYPSRIFVTDGGLVSYGPVTTDLYPRVAGYIDRILKGEKPGDLPVQFPTGFELIVNRKTARALDLEVPPALLAIAGEVIESCADGSRAVDETRSDAPIPGVHLQETVQGAANRRHCAKTRSK